jgi:Holliday junction resolvase-like predicted endonuclease
MSLLAESLVEEWLNRDGFFTIRGVKHGVGEMDLLAVRPQPDGLVVGMHVEVQASFRPIGYIARRTKPMIASDGGNASSARARTPRQIDTCAREWVQNKFRDQAKVNLRKRLWPGVQWSFHLVHAIVREERELRIFEKEGVTCHPFHELLASLSIRGKQSFSGSAGGDLAEIVSYYRLHDSKSRRRRART